MYRACHKHENQQCIKKLIQATTMVCEIVHLSISIKESLISEQLKLNS